MLKRSLDRVILVGLLALLSVQSAYAEKNLVTIVGQITANEHGNRNGIVTIKSAQGRFDLFYAFGEFKTIGAESFSQGDQVTAIYKPEKADYDGILISMEIRKPQPATRKADHTSVDLTPLLRGIENSCLITKEFQAVLKSLGKTIKYPDGRDIWKKSEPIIPVSYGSGFGDLVMANKGDCTLFSLSANGHYYGIPVRSVEYCQGNDNGIDILGIRLAASPKNVAAVLRGKVNQSAHHLYGHQGGPKLAAELVGVDKQHEWLDSLNVPIRGNASETIITCNRSN